MSELSILGLTKNEEKVFKSLIKLGKAGASQISKDSGVSYSRIYDVLASLEHKGLVKVIPEASKKFIPSDPKILKEKVLEKKKALEELEKELENLKQLYELKEGEVVQVAQGQRNFYKLEAEMPVAQEYEYDIKFSSEYRPVFVREAKEVIKKGVDFKNLVKYDEETEKNVNNWLKISKNIRKIENEGVAISIRDDKSILIALIKSNTILLIKDSPFVKIMKTLFSNYYERTEKIE